MHRRSLAEQYRAFRSWSQQAASLHLGRHLRELLTRSARPATRVPWLPLAAACFALRALVAHWDVRLAPYDEGLLFTDAYLMRSGYTIYRDFYVNYPPGILQVVRGILALPVPAIWSCRLIALCIHVASALLAGWLVGQRRKRHGLCPWTVAMTLVLQEKLGLVLYAYLVAVLLALLIALSWPTPGAARLRRVGSGVLLGLVSYFRHDFFTYACTLAASIEIAWWLARRRSFFAGSARELGDFVGGVFVTLAVLWLPIVLHSGIEHTLHDLVLDQARRVQPGRVLPVPDLLDPVDVEGLQMTLPAIFAERTRICLVFALLGTGTSVFALLQRMLRDPEVSRRTRLLAMLTIFAMATLPQALQRTDNEHTAFGVPLVLAALMFTAGRRLAGPALVLALLPWFVQAPEFATLRATRNIWNNRADARFISSERRRVVAFVQRETRPDEPIFVGCDSHRRTLASSLDVYYLARRPGATRYMQFDPGTVTSPAGQQEMIADLQRTRPRLVLRESYCAWHEPNASQFEGATLLDEYLAAHYRESGHIGDFTIWRPKDAS